ncbi:MAG: hypothetical protein LBR07_05435 [Puniceicoccales bacterium]|jgi:hypothetical protein|nr:hypothetical protein [Puniceicoccales bacterium]
MKTSSNEKNNNAAFGGRNSGFAGAFGGQNANETGKFAPTPTLRKSLGGKGFRRLLTAAASLAAVSATGFLAQETAQYAHQTTGTAQSTGAVSHYGHRNNNSAAASGSTASFGFAATGSNATGSAASGVLGSLANALNSGLNALGNAFAPSARAVTVSIPADDFFFGDDASDFSGTSAAGDPDLPATVKTAYSWSDFALAGATSAADVITTIESSLSFWVASNAASFSNATLDASSANALTVAGVSSTFQDKLTFSNVAISLGTDKAVNTTITLSAIDLVFDNSTVSVTNIADAGSGTTHPVALTFATATTSDTSTLTFKNATGSAIHLQSGFDQASSSINGSSVSLSLPDSVTFTGNKGALMDAGLIGSSVFFVGNWGKHANKGYLCKKTPA